MDISGCISLFQALRPLRDTIDVHQYLVRINDVKGLLFNVSNSFVRFKRNCFRLVPRRTLLAPLFLLWCVVIAFLLLLLALASQIDFSGWLLQVLNLASAHRFALLDLLRFPNLPNFLSGFLNR